MIILSIINGNLGRKLFIMMFLFIVSIILLFFAHRCFEKSITDYNKNMEEQLEN